MLLNGGAGEESWESLGLQGDQPSQSILKEINPEYSLEGLMLKFKLQYFGHLLWRADSLERLWCWERLRTRGEGTAKDEVVGWHQLGGHESERTLGDSEGQGSLVCCRHDWATERQLIYSIVLGRSSGGPGVRTPHFCCKGLEFNH